MNKYLLALVVTLPLAGCNDIKMEDNQLSAYELRSLYEDMYGHLLYIKNRRNAFRATCGLYGSGYALN